MHETEYTPQEAWRVFDQLREVYEWEEIVAYERIFYREDEEEEMCWLEGKKGGKIEILYEF